MEVFYKFSFSFIADGGTSINIILFKAHGFSIDLNATLLNKSLRYI